MTVAGVEESALALLASAPAMVPDIESVAAELAMTRRRLILLMNRALFLECRSSAGKEPLRRPQPQARASMGATTTWSHFFGGMNVWICFTAKSTFISKACLPIAALARRASPTIPFFGESAAG